MSENLLINVDFKGELLNGYLIMLKWSLKQYSKTLRFAN